MIQATPIDRSGPAPDGEIPKITPISVTGVALSSADGDETADDVEGAADEQHHSPEADPTPHRGSLAVQVGGPGYPACWYASGLGGPVAQLPSSERWPSPAGKRDDGAAYG